MKNSKKFLIIAMSAIFAAILCCSLIFSIRPSYASEVTIVDTDGTSIYLTGEGVSWDEENSKYEVTNGTDVTIHVVNEYRLFNSMKISGITGSINKPVYTISNVSSDFSIEVFSTAPTDSDVGRYFTAPYVISYSNQLEALEAIFANRTTDEHYNFTLFGLNPDLDDEDEVDAAVAKLQNGYFLLNENILLDTSEFYGIGTATTPFRGNFDFGGYHITLNILNEYAANYNPQGNTSIYSGLFGKYDGDGSNVSILRNANVNGKIAFTGTTGSPTLYHYVGGIAGHVGANLVLGNSHSEVSITLDNDTPLFIGGLFGSLSASLEDRFKYTYGCNYGILQATSHGSGVNMSIGSLAGLIQDTHVYHFEDQSVATHIVGNNLGSGSNNSGSTVVGGIAGTVYANNKDVILKNISAKIHEDRSIIALNDSDSVSGKYVAAGGAYGVFDSLESAGHIIKAELTEIEVFDGMLEVRATTNGASSKGQVYSSGFVGYIDPNSDGSVIHKLIYNSDTNATLLSGDVSIEAINNGEGPVYAGGLFSHNALLIDDGGKKNTITISSGVGDSTLNILAEQGQSSSSTEQREVCAGYFAGRTQNKYAIKNLELIVNNGQLEAHRAIGSTAVGDICAGGFIGKAISNGSDTGYLKDIDVNLNNSSVHALSLSYESKYSDIGNNAVAGGFVGYLEKYGVPSFTDDKWGTSVEGIKNINVNVNNNSSLASEFTIRCVQNAAQGNGDYKSEGYVGGLVGLLYSSYAEKINFNASFGDKALIYYNGTNTPNTAAAGGLVGETRCDQNYGFGINGGNVRNANVIGKAYSNIDSNAYDLYVGGAIGVYGNCNSGTNLVSDLHVFDTSVQSVGEDKMLSFAGGIVGGLWWTGDNTLARCSFVNGDVFASSITHKAYAAGICGMLNRGKIYDCVATNAYVNAKSNDSAAYAAGVCSHFENHNMGSYQRINGCYSQSYVSADGGTASFEAGIAVIQGITFTSVNQYVKTGDLYLDTVYLGESNGAAIFEVIVPSTLVNPSYTDYAGTDYIQNNYFDLGSFSNDYLGNVDEVPLFVNDILSYSMGNYNDYAVRFEYKYVDNSAVDSFEVTYEAAFGIDEENGKTFTVNIPSELDSFDTIAWRYCWRFGSAYFDPNAYARLNGDMDVINGNFNDNNKYIVLYEDDETRATSKNLETTWYRDQNENGVYDVGTDTTPVSANQISYDKENDYYYYLRNGNSKTRAVSATTINLFGEINSSNDGYDKLYVLLDGDTDCFSSSSVTHIDTTNTTSVTTNNNDGLVVASVWINIYGKTANDDTDDIDEDGKTLDDGDLDELCEENGWYAFGSYPIKINQGRPTHVDDKMNIVLIDNDNNQNINFDYQLDDESNTILKQYDEDKDGVFETSVYDVTGTTNVAGYYVDSTKNTYNSVSYNNVQYVLVNMGQTGFNPTDKSHVASSIRISASLTNDGKDGYKNFPRYGFYDSSSLLTGNFVSADNLNATKWVVPSGYDYSSRISTILNGNGLANSAVSSNFNGRLSVERDLDNYALVITPDSYLSERTIITVVFENNRDGHYAVILEFVPNDIYGLTITPGDDTPALDSSFKNLDTDGDGNIDVNNAHVFTYVAGDTVRFEAFEDKRYDQLSFLANVKFTPVPAYGLKANGTIALSSTLPSGTLIPVECSLIADPSVRKTVYIEVLAYANYSINSIGANYSSDRKAVDSTPFNFEFTSAPGFGLAPKVLNISITRTIDGVATPQLYSLAGSSLYYSKDNSYDITYSYTNGVIDINYNSLYERYSVIISGELMENATNLVITIEYPAIYSVVFDTGLNGVDVSERYIVYELEKGMLLDNNFYSTIHDDIFNAIKDSRYGFTLHDYYLTEEASSIPRYGETIVSMTNPISKDVDGNIYHYFLGDGDSEIKVASTSLWYVDSNKNKLFDRGTDTTLVSGKEILYNETEDYYYYLNNSNEVRVVKEIVWYVDDNANGVVDATESKYSNWRTVTGPYTFYARWTYDIAIEVPEGITITSPLAENKILALDPNDPDKGEGKKQPIVPINTNNGFAFIINAKSFDGTPRFMVFEVTVDDEDKFVYKDLTSYVEYYEEGYYLLPQYTSDGDSIINGVIFLKVFSDVADYDVTDIGETGSVNFNSMLEDGIFTVTYNINYSNSFIVGEGNTAAENGLSYVFTDKDGNPLKLPKDTSLRLYRSFNGVAYDSGYYVITDNDGTNQVNVSSFTKFINGSSLNVANGTKIDSEEYNLVVTLPFGYDDYATDYLNAKVTINTSYTDLFNQYAYTLTYRYDDKGNIVKDVVPKSDAVLDSPIRHSAFYEKAFDVFNIYNYNPASGLVSRVSGTTEATSGFTLQFTPSSGKQPNIFDHRHGSSYYLWEVEKTYSTDEAGATVVRQYTAKDDAGSTVSIVSETQHYYYYLATNGNLNLSNVPTGCKIRLLEVDSLSNPAAGIVICTYPAN